MRQLAVSDRFRTQLRKLPAQDQRKAAAVLERFLTTLPEGRIPVGFGFKKINGDKYELRVNLRLRVVMKAEGDVLICHLIGNHEDVRRYLREYRNK